VSSFYMFFVSSVRAWKAGVRRCGPVDCHADRTTLPTPGNRLYDLKRLGCSFGVVTAAFAHSLSRTNGIKSLFDSMGSNPSGVDLVRAWNRALFLCCVSVVTKNLHTLGQSDKRIDPQPHAVIMTFCGTRPFRPA